MLARRFFPPFGKPFASVNFGKKSRHTAAHSIGLEIDIELADKWKVITSVNLSNISPNAEANFVKYPLKGNEVCKTLK